MVRRPLISCGREMGCTTQPPIVGCPYLGKFRLPHPEEAARPPCPWSHLSLPFGSWAHRAQILQASVSPPPVGSLDLTLGTVKNLEGGAGWGLVSSGVKRGNSRGFKNELGGARLEAVSRGSLATHGGPAGRGRTGQGTAFLCLEPPFECTQPLVQTPTLGGSTGTHRFPRKPS